MKRTEILRKLINENGIIVAPGAYDSFSAKIIELTGFKAVHASGGGISRSLLGGPDVGLLTMPEMLNQVKNIVNAVHLPVIADIDTGYGNPMNVMRTIREFEQIGVAGIHMEDQEMPKKCGHLEGKKLISKREMAQKIRAACEARQDKDFMIIARTDAQAVYGLDEAIERGQEYVSAGADAIFVESPASVEEMKKIVSSFKVPLLLNRGGGKKTPWLSVFEIEEIGFKIVIFPGDAQKAAGKAMLETMKVLKEKGNTTSVQDRMLSFEERNEISGLKEFYELEGKFA